MKREAIASLALGVVGAATFTVLLVTAWIGEWAYLLLMVGLATACLALYGFRRLKVLDLKEGRLVLEQVERAKKEVFAGLEDLKALTRYLAKVLALNHEVQNRMMTRESSYLLLQWNRHMIASIMERLDLPQSEQAAALEYLDTMIRIDETPVAAERTRIVNALWVRVKADVLSFGMRTELPPLE